MRSCIIPNLLCLTWTMAACVTNAQTDASACMRDSESSCTRGAGSERAVVIVVGSGLAGLSAAMEAASGGAEVIVVEKQPFVGGNSAKATSGINAVGTNAQQAQGVLDSYELFEEDTMRAAQHSNDYGMVRKLTRESTASVQWLEERTGLSLTALTQCGGHSAQRTHRLDAKRDTSAPVAVGRALVKGLYAALDAEPRVRFMLNTEAQRLLHTREADTVTVTGVRVRNTETGAEEELLADSVVLASGGFAYAAADDTQSMLAQYAPQYSSLPTTSGAQADGSGLRLALDMQVDVVTRDMQHVQIHPTGFVDPRDPLARSKILCPEALRGCGALLLDAKGRRFCNELGTRDYVSQRILEHEYGHEQKEATLFFNEEVATCFGPSLAFYVQRGLVQQMTGAEVHEKLQMDEITLRHTLQSYECAASNSDSAKAEDRCADEFGKRTFPVALWPFSADEHTTYYVARMTPVVHYTMGGLKTDCDAAVLRELKEHDDGRFQQVKGLFAAGEVAGGVHGSNRLAGNSLLECVVFGRTAGAAAAQVCS